MIHQYSSPILKNALLHGLVESPVGAIFLLAWEIERELRLMLACTGQLQEFSGTAIEALDVLSQKPDVFAIPESLRSSVASFYNLKNDLAHDAHPPRQIVHSAVDYGAEVVEVLHRVPRWSYVVVHDLFHIFSDSEGKNQRLGVRGVILWPISPKGESMPYLKFPTRKSYFPGTKVSWEWDLRGPGWDESWYFDPMTKKIEHAWGGSLEFVGRPLDQV